MTWRKSCGDNKVLFIFLLVTISSIISPTAGIGVFQIKVLSMDLTTPPTDCIPEAAAPCPSDQPTCGNNSVVFRVCLSHHQHPVPHTLHCTFGQEVLILSHVPDVNSKDRNGITETLMSIPFNFSWPAGFICSVSASWDCHGQKPAEESVFSNIVIADQILPSRQWTTFNNPQHAARPILQRRHPPSRPQTTHSPSRPQTTHADNKMTTLTQTAGHSTQVKSHLVSLSKNSLANISKSIHQHTFVETNSESDPSVSKQMSDDNSLAEILMSKRSNVSRPNPWKSVYTKGNITAASDETDPSSMNNVHILSTAAWVRLFGSHIVVAVRVLCSDNYYGKNCSEFCRPRNNQLHGHYSCSEAGQPTCLPGWRGSNCTEAVCSPQCHPSRGNCISPNTCTCREGWFGEHCQQCRTHPGCKHGYCLLPGQCVCLKGWSGPLCDVEELFCLERKPCQNGGTCLHDRSFNYTCNCPVGYTGAHCEVPLCHVHFCMHGGTCQIDEGTRHCLCPPSFAGDRCQKKVISPMTGSTCIGPMNSSTEQYSLDRSSTVQSPCKDVSCHSGVLIPPSCQEHFCCNGGKCILHAGSQIRECWCPFPFTGPRCLRVRNPCQINPCHNGADCETKDPFTGSFKCLCKEGYSGSLCDKKVAPLSLKHTICDGGVICQNGGECRRSERSEKFLCKCSAHYTGEFCEIDINNPCATHVCLNGGKCVLGKRKDAVCVCRKRFVGTFCEQKFRGKENTLTIHLETLTIKDERLEVIVHTISSNCAKNRTRYWIFPTVCGFFVVLVLMIGAIDSN